MTSEVLDFPLFRCRTPLTPPALFFRRRRRVSASWHCASRRGFLWGPSWEVSCLARPIGRLGRLGRLDGWMMVDWILKVEKWSCVAGRIKEVKGSLSIKAQYITSSFGEERLGLSVSNMANSCSRRWFQTEPRCPPVGVGSVGLRLKLCSGFRPSPLD